MINDYDKVSFHLSQKIQFHHQFVNVQLKRIAYKTKLLIVHIVGLGLNLIVAFYRLRCVQHDSIAFYYCYQNHYTQPLVCVLVRF